MIVVNTTCGWQVGDDLIRAGALSVLGVTHDDAKFYVNRAQVAEPGGPASYTSRAVAMPSPDDVMARATLFACAGTPEWHGLAEEWWDAALRHGVPIALVGVGCTQPSAAKALEAAVAKGLVVGATARDDAALRQLELAGVPYPAWFPCPSTAAGWDPRLAKRVDLVVNPRLRCGPRASGGAHYWLEGQGAALIRWTASSRGSSGPHFRVVVHEPDEVRAFYDAFGFAPWYSSDPADYRALYSRTAVYVGARLHGALPVAAAGGTAYLLPQAAKFAAAARVEALAPGVSSLKLRATMEVPMNPDSRQLLLGRIDPSPLLRQLAAQSEAHRAYWAGLVPRWRR